jgi:hypothetical protein
MEKLIATGLCLVFLGLGYALGRSHKFAKVHADAVKLGRALEWQDYFFAKIEKENRRHGKDGKFTTPNKTA